MAKRYVAMAIADTGEMGIIDTFDGSAYMTLYQVEKLLNDKQNIIEKQAGHLGKMRMWKE